MGKSANKPAPARSKGPLSAAKPLATGKAAKAAKPTSAASGILGPAESSSPTRPPNSESKKARVLSMLRSPTGATIAAMVQATGWQQHSVRGFLAGVVRKRLKLKLGSKKVDGTRVYGVATGDSGKTGARRSKRQSF